MNRTTWVAALGATVLVAAGVYALLPAGTGRHLDGEGELASHNGPGYEGFAADQTKGVGSWTFGLRLCRASGDEPAVIDSVGPASTVGAGYRFMGALVRRFDLTASHEPIISVDGYPPPPSMVPDPVVPAVGYAVETPCPEGPSGPYTELLVGMTVTGPDGGGWRGIDIAYHVGSRHRTLVVNQDWVICGDSVPDCTSPPTGALVGGRGAFNAPGTTAEARR